MRKFFLQQYRHLADNPTPPPLSAFGRRSHEAMFHEAKLYQDPTNDTHFMLCETWKDHDDVVDVQLHRPYRRKWHDALPEILAQPRDISTWRL
jgi:quinol monooxygenase YgiN